MTRWPTAIDEIEYNPLAKSIENNGLLMKYHFLEALNEFPKFKVELEEGPFAQLMAIDLDRTFLLENLESWANSSLVLRPSIFLIRSNSEPNEVVIQEERKRFFDWFPSLADFLRMRNLESEWLVRHLAGVLSSWLRDEKNRQESLSAGLLQSYVKGSTYSFQFEIRKVNENKRIYIERTKRAFETKLNEFLDALEWLYQDQTPIRNTDAELVREHMNWFLSFQVEGTTVKEILNSVREAEIDRATVDKRIKRIGSGLGIQRRKDRRGRPNK
jgi:hypothetical protein